MCVVASGQVLSCHGGEVQWLSAPCVAPTTVVTYLCLLFDLFAGCPLLWLLVIVSGRSSCVWRVPAAPSSRVVSR